ncbi:hypothetical protein GCM10023149_30480 [Mucilaginibacter gynuensis]|uniref:DUF4440 domain-containing protein n=1 Tax=Mucilaginibacter gynuensis TaxID=1302236 RepID=A0ABP8GMY1_9SPHI
MMEQNSPRVPIEQLIYDFEEAFNSKNISLITSSFTGNGTVMPNNAPLVQGSAQLQALYKNLFEAFDITVKYEFEDLQLSGDLAVVRTGSKVTTIVKANQQKMLLENKELFVLQQEDQAWKIVNYIFNTNHKI